MTTFLANQWSHLKQNSIVAFLGSNSVDYLLTILALLKLSITVMMISPRNSDDANINLFSITGSKHLLVSSKYYDKADTIAKNTTVQITRTEAFDLSELKRISRNTVTTIDDDIDLEKAVLIIHSSGTTRYPKPIYLGHRFLFYCALFFETIRAQNEDPEKVPPQKENVAKFFRFHGFGFSSMVSCVTVGASLVLLENAAPSQTEIHQAIRKNKVSLLMISPTLLKDMVSYLCTNSADLTIVQSLKYIIFGGAPLQYKTGLWFRKNKINIRNAVGSTETGLLMISDMVDNDNWYALTPLLADANGVPYCTFENIDGELQMYVRKGYPIFAMDISNREDGGYSTNDIYTPDPAKPGYYYYVGRSDDVLVFENGEKTNPVPIESNIRQSPLVKQVAVIGHGRKCAMALIEIDRSHAKKCSRDDIKRQVDRAVQTANKESSTHAVIMPQMIKILPSGASLPSTEKGTLMRTQIEQLYRDIINDTYAEFIQNPSREACLGDTIEFINQSLASVLKCLPHQIDPDCTFFDLGLDSLTAIQLWNMLVKRFGLLPHNFIYQHPTLHQIQDAIIHKRPRNSSRMATETLAEFYIERAKSEFPAVEPHKTRPQTVLLTGATGSLGAFLLRDLLKTNVKKVYCMIRGKEPRERLERSLSLRHIDLGLLDSSRLEILPMLLDEPCLGLGKKRYLELKNEIDTVQHCGWTLDFNLEIEYYNKACIAPFYNLIRFAYKEKPMHIHFISSVSVYPLMDIGYSQSKYVVERLLTYLKKEKNMPCTIERVGQICGDSQSGVWNTSEQFPLMIMGGASKMKKMPRLDSLIVDWIPIDFASAAIVNIMIRPDHDCAVCFIVNPNSRSWSDLLDSLAQHLEFKTISSIDWLSLLSKDHTNPAYRLLSHFQSLFKSDGFISTVNNSCTGASSLYAAPKIDSQLVGKYLDNWKSIGFL